MKRKQTLSVKYVLSMKAPIKDNIIFYPGALISKAPIVFNIFILFNLFYSGQFFCLETGLPPMTMWSFEPRIGLALC